MIKIKDTRGNESNTLGFAVVTFLVGTGAFLYKLPTETPFGLAEYGAFVVAAVLPFVAREFIKKDK